MNRQIVAPVIVVTFVILAGCVGGSSDLTSQSPTDADDGSDGDVTLVENRTAALMAAGSYTAVWQMSFLNASEGESWLTYTNAVNFDDERSTFDMRTASDGVESTAYESFQGDGVSYTRYGTGEDATYSVRDAPFTPTNTLFPVESYVSSGGLSEFSAAGTETYDGVTVTRYERTDRPAWIGQQGSDAEITWTEFSYVVLVDADGLVRYESWGAEGVDADDGEHGMAFSYALTGVGSTAVDDPDWLGAADAQSNR